MAENDGLTRKQVRAVAALLTAHTIEEAAQSAGISERTLQRWLADECFRAALHREQREFLGQVVRRLAGLQDKALAALEEIMDSTDVPPACRLRAVQMVLANLSWLRDLSDQESTAMQLKEIMRVLGIRVDFSKLTNSVMPQLDMPN